jgi:hypothetical protein
MSNTFRKMLQALSVLLLFAAGALGQTVNTGVYPGNLQGATPAHRVGGIFMALGYSGWQAQILSGNNCAVNAGTNTCTSAPATGTVILYPNGGGNGGCITLQDGACVAMASIFNTVVPIQFNDNSAPSGSLPEVVTPSSVSLGPCPAGFIGAGSSTVCATVTGSFYYNHGGSGLVNSGDVGIEEAITDAGAQGGGSVFWMVDTGIVTASTGGVTTTTTVKIPTTFYTQGASGRITTTVATATTWSVGVSGTTAAFCTSDSTMTAGQTCGANQAATALVGTGSTALTAILFTFTGTPSAGALKTRVWGYTPVQAAS